MPALLLRFLHAWIRVIFVTVVLLLLLSVLVLQSEDPLQRIDTCTVIVFLSGAFSCGFFGRGIKQEHPILGAVATFALYLALLGVGNVLLVPTQTSAWRRLLWILFGSAACALGALSGGKFRLGKGHRRKRRTHVRRS